MNDKNQSAGIKKALKEYWYVFTIIISLFISFFCGLVYIVPEIHFAFPPTVNIGNMGVFGDSFNVLTSLFTGLAFAGLLVSIFLQRKDLELQREELKETRKEFKSMNELQDRQQFRTDVQRDIEYIKNSIKGMNIVLNNVKREEILELMGSSPYAPNYSILNEDCLLIKDIFENHIKIFYKRYFNSKNVENVENVEYAKDEIFKAISANNFNYILKFLFQIYFNLALIRNNFTANEQLLFVNLMNILKCINNQELNNSFSNYKNDNNKIHTIKELIEYEFSKTKENNGR